MTRFIFVTGGVTSSLGKGLTAASLGALLLAHGFNVCLRKLDPYLNVDPGTMSPSQHGEVFVTDDGAETDLDLGHYERFTGIPAKRTDSVTAGQIYRSVIRNERQGRFLGATVQVIPHVTDAIKTAIQAETEEADFVICEIGGTVGDIECLPFLEAIRQMRSELGAGRTLFLHLTLLPWLRAAAELKTKPTQHSVKELLSAGIQADLLVCRSEVEISDTARNKIALFCNLSAQRVIPAQDVANIYQLPLNLHEVGLDREVLQFFSLSRVEPDLCRWRGMLERIEQTGETVRIGVVSKYLSVFDSYKSLQEALHHGGIAHQVRVEIEWIDAELLEETIPPPMFAHTHGILVPGAFGIRGARGKIAAAAYAREHKIPFLGICFGMQMAVIAALRRLDGLENAGSSEFGPCPHPVVGHMTEWLDADAEGLQHRSPDDPKGGTMRLGGYPCRIQPDSKAWQIYQHPVVRERHRHRYEINIDYQAQIQQAGLQVSGLSPDGNLPEIIEDPDHPWYIGVQFHPELQSRPFAPHPLFASFIDAALRQSRLL